MTPELQSVLDRLELVERQNRGLRGLTLLAIFVGLAAVGFVAGTRLFAPPEIAPAPQRQGVVEANRFLLRDAEGRLRGGMEVEGDGTVKLAIGNQDGRTGAAVILAQPTGLVQIQLRSPTGVVRAALNGTIEPSLSLTSDDGGSSAALITKSGNPGRLFLSDRSGTMRPGP